MNIFYPPVALAVVAILYFRRSKYPFMLTFGQKVTKVVLQTGLILIGVFLVAVLSEVGRRLTGNDPGLMSDHAFLDLMIITIAAYFVTCYRGHPKGSPIAKLRSFLATLTAILVSLLVFGIVASNMNMAAASLIPSLLMVFGATDKLILREMSVQQGAAVSPTHYISKNFEIKLIDNSSAEKLEDRFSVYLRYDSGKNHGRLIADLKKRYGDEIEPNKVVADFDGHIVAYGVEFSGDKLLYAEYGCAFSWGCQEKVVTRTGRDVKRTVVGGGTSLGMTTGGEMVFVSNPTTTVTEYGDTYTYDNRYGIFEFFMFFDEVASISPVSNSDPFSGYERNDEGRDDLSKQLFVKYFDENGIETLGGVLSQIRKVLIESGNGVRRR
ncbi:hypothetical protein [Ralstonia pickettii]|jgi:hypothetical protein|uniref:Transmembrane protein n=3 Tax=Pseudomonadota TaxID=1224 RepID=A0ABN9I5Q6_RALPI|nr:hypothetical protein [Ralstonia pickettii]CAJ0730938.1 hypothetical protein R38712_04551 [Ralstonia pickettii]